MIWIFSYEEHDKIEKSVSKSLARQGKKVTELFPSKTYESREGIGQRMIDEHEESLSLQTASKSLTEHQAQKRLPSTSKDVLAMEQSRLTNDMKYLTNGKKI